MPGQRLGPPHAHAHLTGGSCQSRAVYADVYPDHFFSDEGARRSAFQNMLDALGPALAAGGVDPAVQFAAVTFFFPGETRCPACVVGCHMPMQL